DPIALLAQMQRFSQPSEVAMPIEILRLGMVLQARGLMNHHAIQHNLDWIWPYWVKQQFKPGTPAFVPRAFSLTQINLTHRNWTALGMPDYSDYPLVDPRGLITPFYDSWSLDMWIVTSEKKDLIPSEAERVTQELIWDQNFSIRTAVAQKGLSLSFTAEVEDLKAGEAPFLRIQLKGSADRKAWLAVSLRPYNPEGVSFVHQIDILKNQPGWCVDNQKNIYFNTPWDAHRFSQYHYGDVYRKLPEPNSLDTVKCPVGMASAAALFEIQPEKSREITVDVPLKEKEAPLSTGTSEAAFRWKENLRPVSALEIPEAHFKFLYDAAIRTLILHSPREIYPGPFTYKHFWFRDAAIISYAMLCAGMISRVEKVIEAFLGRQTLTGYFHSQDGEWDSNGQVLWLLRKFCQLTGKKPKEEWKGAILNAARWIQKKRLSSDLKEIHAGLFPAGFSAEHLGPNDYYYWDDFWGVEGLQSAAWLFNQYEEKNLAEEFEKDAKDFLLCVERSLEKVSYSLGHPTMPASPYRRLDAGAIGSVVAGYPLRLWPEKDSRLLATVHYLMKECFVDGVFFHDISHSGINAYLTLHIAQVLLRAGESGFLEILNNLASLATPTGQWPEAIHHGTRGGCMGDGQHVWAAA
ncbi:MAG: hypothetical protein HYZ85_03455, partial [Candidatus Omnitrophica bacterium]|nr:hypothetical protein [Candidatus Omnitrophota bacterium]